MPPWETQSNARLSLLFEPGQRLSAVDVLRLAESREPGVSGFAVSHQPEPSAGWLELLAAYRILIFGVVMLAVVLVFRKL